MAAASDVRQTAILPKDVDLALLAGFVDPRRVLGHGERKDAAARMRARVAAAELVIECGPRLRFSALAQRLDVSERSLSRWFPVREAVLAFPPPEFAAAIVGVGLAAPSWAEVPGCIRPLFSDLDRNPTGRRLLNDLVIVHHAHSGLRAADGYFAEELRRQLQINLGRAGARAVAMVGYFTEGLRAAFDNWARQPDQSVLAVADSIEVLLSGPLTGEGSE